MDKKVVTIPIAAKASVGLFWTLPTTAASVNDKIGSDTPAIKAGIASLFMFFKLIELLKIDVKIGFTKVVKDYRSFCE